MTTFSDLPFGLPAFNNGIPKRENYDYEPNEAELASRAALQCQRNHREPEAEVGHDDAPAHSRAPTALT